jgi:hypothetical protein
VVVAIRPLHGLANQAGGGEVEDGLRRGAVEAGIERRRVGEVDPYEGRARWHGGGVPFAQVIDDDNLMALGDELVGDDAPDVAGAARDDETHLDPFDPWAQSGGG